MIEEIPHLSQGVSFHYFFKGKKALRNATRLLIRSGCFSVKDSTCSITLQAPILFPQKKVLCLKGI